MRRAEKVKVSARQIIDEGRRPSARAISQDLEMSGPDVHRCLNSLEKQGEIKTYRRKVMGVEHRMVGVNR